jgi:hypothetical protein
VSGATPAAAREAIMARVRSGATQVLCNCELVTEGFDVPEVACIVVVRPTLSRALHEQMLGRGLRVAPGKTECLVLDHAGNTIRHGVPTDERRYSLERGIELPSFAPAPASRSSAIRREIVEDASVTLQEAACLALRSGERREVLSAQAARACGLLATATEPDASRELRVRLTPVTSASGEGKTRAWCGGRIAFLRGSPWATEWIADLAKVVSPPARADVKSHVCNLMRMLKARHNDSKFTPAWAAARLLEQWGADEAAALVAEGSSHPGARELLRNKASKQVRAQLAALMRAKRGSSAAEECEDGSTEFVLSLDAAGLWAQGGSAEAAPAPAEL